MIIDTHCHLDSFLTSSVVLTRSKSIFKKYNLTPQFIAMSVSPESWSSVVELSSIDTSIHAALGIHPWYVDSKSSAMISTLQSLLLKHQIVGLGEIGLDFSLPYQHTKQLQIEIFEAQLHLASALGKPVSIHVMKAHNELYHSLRQHNVKGVIHGLGSSLEVARNYVNCGFKIGVNGVVLRDNAVRYHALVRYFGLQHIVLETDYPNIMLPGLVNSNLHDIIRVAEKVALLLNISFDEVLHATNHNALNIFKLNVAKHI